MTPPWFPLTRDQATYRPTRQVPPLIAGILAAIAAVEALSWLMPPAWFDALVWTFGAQLFDTAGALRPERLYTFATYWLLHGGFWHAAFNGLWIFAFGPFVLRHTGPRRFVVFFLGSAAGGAAAHVISSWGMPAVAIGASGIVFGLIGAGAFLLTQGPTVGRKLVNMALYLALFTALNVAFAVMGGESLGVSGRVSWQAHLGGMIAGVVLFPLLARGPAVPPSGRRPDHFHVIR